MGGADLLRRAMGKKIKEEMDKQRARFVDGAVKNGVSKAQADIIFDLLAKFANYGFNKSHAAAYDIVSYQTAYMKAHYPVEFLAASMTLDMANTEKLVDFRQDAGRLGIEVVPPSVQTSFRPFEVGDNCIYFSLAAIKGVGEAVATDIKLIAATAHRMLKSELKGKKVLASWSSVVEYCHAAMAYETREQFRILFLDKRNALIADEVQPGFGRTGTHMWGHQYAGFVPDIVTMGKPMGNGHPVGAVVAGSNTLNAFRKAFRYFNTFGGNPVSCAAAMAVLDVIEEDRLMENAGETGAYARAGLARLGEKHDIIGQVRGSGLFFGAELVLDRKTKQPASDMATRVINEMRRRGVLMGKLGIHQNATKIRPPMPFSKENADLMLSTLDDVLSGL